MILRKHINYFNKVIVFFTAFILLFGLDFSQNVLALNGKGNKAVNFIGYRITDKNTLKIWVDKNVPETNVDKAQFKIFEGSGTDGQRVGIQSATVLRESNITGVNGLGNGADIILTTSEALVSGQIYTVEINNTVRANNGLTLGQFTAHKDIIFSFTVPSTIEEPNGNGSYSSSAPAVLNSSMQDGTTNVPVEGDIWISTRVPVTNYNEVINGLVLKKNNQNIQYDTSIDENKDGDIYAPLVNDDHTYFFFPMTGSGGCYSYNLDANADYELTIPDMQLINGQTISGRTITFHTGGSTVATKINGVPSASQSGDNLQITWTAPSAVANVSPAPSGYNVYASTDKYWGYEKLNVSPISGDSTSYITSGLKANTTYYLRVSALSNTNILTGESSDLTESGFSDAVQATISADTNTPAENVGLDESSKTLTVDANKTWKIRFNKDIVYDDLTKQGIVITDAKGNVVNVGLELGQDNKTLIVTALQGGYTAGENYVLVVNDKVHSKEDKTLKNQYKLYFNIKN